MTGIPSWAVRGAKVVCIDADWQHENNRIDDPAGLMSYPVKDEVYTIAEVRVRFVPEWGSVMVGITLREIANPIAAHGSATGEDMAFDIGCFRPLTANRAERDVAMFLPILDQVPEDA